MSVQVRKGRADATTTKLIALLMITASSAPNRNMLIKKGNRNSAPPRPINPASVPMPVPLANALTCPLRNASKTSSRHVYLPLFLRGYYATTSLRRLLIFEHLERLVEATKAAGHEIDRDHASVLPAFEKAFVNLVMHVSIFAGPHRTCCRAPIWVAANPVACSPGIPTQGASKSDFRTPRQFE